MKRLLSTIALCLLTATLLAQQKYTLTVKTLPQYIGTIQLGYTIPGTNTWSIFRTSTAELQPGAEVTVYMIDILSGWKIREWRVTQGSATVRVQSDNYAEITMPAEDVTLTLMMVYDPDNPENPQPNAWYPDDGKLIVDHLGGDSFYTWLRKLIPDQEDYSLVRTIVVGGYASYISMDYFDTNTFENLRRLDLSRLSDNSIRYVYNCDGRPWEELLLPASVKEIYASAFESTYLNELTIYATTPPTLSMEDVYDDQGFLIGQRQNAFPSSRDMTVYVPEESLPLYRAADGWKEFDLQPIVEDAANLKVSVEAADGDLLPYYGMTLQIQNVKSLSTRSMIIGPRKDYTFNTLPRHTSYDVRLLSRTGSVVAQATNVYLGDEDASVTLGNLRRPCSLQLAVTAGNAPVDNDQYDCLWTDSEGRILSRSSQINAILEDEPVQALITLNSSTLKTTYRERDTIIISRPGDYAQGYTHQLRPIPTHQLTTQVKRADGLFIGRQTVQLSVNHTATGQLVRQLSFSTLTADGYLSSGPQDPLPEGEYEVTARVEDSKLGTVTQHLSLRSDQTLTFLLSEANGSTVKVKWTHKSVADEGSASQSTEMSPAEAAITLRDLTNGRNLDNYAVTAAGYLRLQEQLEPGTEVELTLGNQNNQQYAPVTQRQQADADGNLSFDVTTCDYGSLTTSFTATECSRVSMRLYNNSGQLVAARNATTTSETFTQLRDGDYTVLLMEGGTMANAMNTLADVEQFMKRGTDYVSQQVNVSAGQTAMALFTSVPALSSATHLYTDDSGTRLTPKKPQIGAGLYQTFSTQVVFRPEYKNRISQLKAILTLPADGSLHFVEGSVILDNSTTPYTFDGQQLIVPIIEKRLMRFCAMPLKAGQQTLSGKLSFLLDGEPCEQPLPSASFSVSGADFYCPEVTESDHVLATGTALPSTPVTIVVNGEQAGTVNTDNQGQWQMNVPLGETYNGAVNSLYAQYTSSDGYLMKTETREVTLDRYGIRPLSVYMTHFNKWTASKQAVTFNLETNTCTPSGYYFYKPAEFTFDVTLNTTDTTNIDRVMLYVYSLGNQRRILFPQFNKQTGTWVATDIFNSYNLPTQVRVYVEARNPQILGDQAIHDAVHVFDELAEQLNNPNPELTALTETALNSEPGSAEEDEALNQMMINTGVNPNEVRNVETLPDTPEEKAKWEAEMDALLANFDLIDADYNQLDADGYISFNVEPMNQMGQLFGGYTFSTISNSTRQYYAARARGEQPAPLPAAGPNEEEYVINLESGEKAYYRLHDNGYIIVVPTEDLQITVDYSAMNTELAGVISKLQGELEELHRLKLQAPLRAGEPSFKAKVAEIIGEITKTIDQINGYLQQIHDYYDAYVVEGIKRIDGNIQKIKDATQAGWDKFWKGNVKWRTDYRLHGMKIRAGKAMEEIDKLKLGKLKLEKLQAKFGSIMGKIGKAGKLLSILSLIGDYNDFVETYQQALDLYYSVPDPCKKEQAKADALRSSIDNWAYARMAQKGLAILNDAASVASALAGILATITTAGTGVVFGGIGVGASLAISTGNWLGNIASDKIWEYKISSFRKQINELKCKEDSVPCDKKPILFDQDADLETLLANGGAGGAGGASSTTSTGCGSECQKATPKGDGEGGCPGPPPPPPPGTIPVLDPSGYVYEAVGSNRVADALTSVYYKEIYEDMYGDSHERSVLWDAGPFEQVNPMLTDQNGEYGWDVPPGLWQVRVVKDGYLTTESEWLPVPPPQLDVNLPMVQPTAPQVQRVVATGQGVELRFDKYMKPEQLNADNIFFTRNGEKLEGSISLKDAEPTPDSTKTFVRSLLFQPKQSLKLGEKVRLTVRAGVESYANVGMLTDFTQEFDVEQRVNQIVVDSVVGMAYDEDYTLEVSALPAAVAKGKTLKVASLDPTIVELKTESVVLDQDGKATLSIHGKGYGTTGLRFVLADDADVQALTLVGVRSNEGLMTRMPTSSLISGVEVKFGTLLRLNCETPGATIYYTLDGSCPCDNPNRLRYDGPIVLTHNVTLKAIAIAPGYAESDVATFNYIVLPDPNSIESVGATTDDPFIYTMEGVRVAKESDIRKGVYILNGRKIVVK